MTEKTFPAQVESIAGITEMVDRALVDTACPAKARMQIDVAVDEIVSNIARYAYKTGTGDVTVRVSFDEGRRTVRLDFCDGGVPYDPLTAPDPDVTLNAGERGVGGLGVYLVKRIMDDVRYEYMDGHNILTLKKGLVTK